jgi:hypothetical protein
MGDDGTAAKQAAGALGILSTEVANATSTKAGKIR